MYQLHRSWRYLTPLVIQKMIETENELLKKDEKLHNSFNKMQAWNFETAPEMVKVCQRGSRVVNFAN